MAITLNSQSGINFNDVTLPGVSTGNRRTNSPYKDKTTGNDASARSTTEISEPTQRFINCIDIDWNSAQLSDAISSLSSNVQEGVAVNNITTTGELLKVVAQLQAQVNALTSLMKGLYATLAA